MHDIRPFLPELFDNPGTLLYIGARVDAHSWLEDLLSAGHKITILEIWPENIRGLEKTQLVILGDVRSVDDLFGNAFDYIFYWHGPEHLAMPDIEPTLQKLESRCSRLIALACPWGDYPQGAHMGNPYEVHQSTLYPEFFQVLGYNVRVDGEADKAGSEIVAWKVME